MAPPQHGMTAAFSTFWNVRHRRDIADSTLNRTLPSRRRTTCDDVGWMSSPAWRG